MMRAIAYGPIEKNDFVISIFDGVCSIKSWNYFMECLNYDAN